MTNTASWQPAYVSSHANLTCFQRKVSCALNGKFCGCLSSSRRSWSFEFTRAAQMPVQPAIPSSLVLETVPSVENSSCWINTTKNQSLSGPVLLRHHKAYRSATRGGPRLESVFASASVAGQRRRVPAGMRTYLQGKTRGEHDHIEVAEDVSRDSTQWASFRTKNEKTV